LNIFPVHVPPLRERAEDVSLLTSHFIGEFSRRMGKTIEQVAPDAMNALIHYSWPGNVRELANLLERAVILCDEPVLQREHIAISDMPVSADSVRSIETLQEVEREQILKALVKAEWTIGGPSGAANLLGLKRTTLLARMKKLGISRPAI